MSKIVYTIIILVLIAGGIIWWQGWQSGPVGPMTDNATTTAPTNLPTTNLEMLQTELDATSANLPIRVENEVEYFENSKGYFVEPEVPGSYPGVVLIHENRGLRPETKGMAEQLARDGFKVLAVDLLGEVVETQDQARVLTASFDQKKGIENMQAAVDFLKSKGATKVASLGWCFGGAQSLQLALSGEALDATVIYYGRLATTTVALAPIKWPVLGVFGDQDQSISVESVKQFETALDTLKVENEIYVYPGVGHAFANPSGMNYAPSATKDAWLKTVAFLKKSLD